MNYKKLAEFVNAVGAIINAPADLERTVYRDNPEDKSTTTEHIALSTHQSAEDLIKWFPSGYSSLKLSDYWVVRTDVPGTSDQRLIGFFQLSWFPGCCAYAISTNVYVAPAYRGRRVNTTMLRLREYLAYSCDYTGLVATCIARQVGSYKALERAGFTKIETCENRRTGNTVFMYLKHLNPSEFTLE